MLVFMTKPLREQLNTYKPTEIWAPDMELDEPILRAVEQMNRQDTKLLQERLKKQVHKSENGVVYALVNGDNPIEYSLSSAMVMFNPYANCATPNMLRRAEFIRLVAREYGITDANGQYLPVIMLANPGIKGSKLSLDDTDREKISHGDLGPFAAELLRAVELRNIGRIALFGFSQGADVAAAGYSQAYNMNMDVVGLAVGDPAGVKRRSTKTLRKDFMQAGIKQLHQSIDRGGLEHQKETQGTKDFARFLISSLHSINQDLYKGLGVKDFDYKIMQALGLRNRQATSGNIVVGYGGNSAISQPEKLEQILSNIQSLDKEDVITTIKVEGANHTWGDQLTLLTALYMRALKQ